MVFPISLLGSRVKLFAAGGIAVAIALFVLAFYLRGQQIAVCEAERAAIAAYGEQVKQRQAEAVKRLQEEKKRIERQRDRTLREARNVKDATTSPAIANAARLLCSQGAAGCDTARVD